MDLVTVKEVAKPGPEGVGSIPWREGDAWLAGGTWLFSEPQIHLRRLIDLHGLGWEPMVIREDGLEIAATCPISHIEHFEVTEAWPTTALFKRAARALLASFKIQKTATVGGNVCMSLPAGAMISLTSALEGVCTILTPGGGERRVPVAEFVTGDNKNLLGPGDLLRSIHLPASALRKKAAMRRFSMTHEGRSAVFLLATLADDGAFLLTVTASTFHPVQLAFDAVPSSETLLDRLTMAIPDSLYFNDVNGSPEFRKHMTLIFAKELRRDAQEGRF